MRTCNKKRLICRLKKEESQLKLMIQLQGRSFTVGYLTKSVNCHVQTAQYIVRRIEKYGKL